ncbi:BRO family protein [Clostridium ljungdahlii]|uniref:Bro-N domain-containing protein n=1 Tax=Clostridium ljungdahlii TaxID=1538 RepID=A0A162J7K9_9CLOT|nr:BRO family protein [Clostridium ljungdahlii]OAA91465.1 hypothetical protein WY13_00722 [Clostridium ljungdahlii]
MENNLVVFNNEQFGAVRTVAMNNEPWFVAKDVADILGYSQTQAMLKRLDEEDFMSSKLDGMNMLSTIINESGLYSAILGSKKPEAKKFKRWVTAEVLPTIRKNGMYITDKLLDDTDFLVKTVARLAEERKARLLLEQQNAEKTALIEEQKPKIDYFNAFMSDGKTGTTTQLAGYINQYFRITLSAQTLNKLLLEMGVLNKKVGWSISKKTGKPKHKGNYIINTKYAGMGWHVYVQGVADDGTSSTQLRWTNIGVYEIIQFIDKHKQKYGIA